MVEQEPTGDHWRTLDHLALEVRRAADKVDNDREINERRIAASTRKFRAWRFAGLVGIALSVLALWAGWRADTAINRINSSRAEARVAACNADNAYADKVNALNDRTQELLRAAFAANTSRTPTEQVTAEAFLADELARFDAVRVPARKCDPASIAAFYKSK